MSERWTMPGWMKSYEDILGPQAELEAAINSLPQGGPIHNTDKFNIICAAYVGLLTLLRKEELLKETPHEP